jgi:tRNA (adenine57-N1/adenine58-N1)-methyltransferase
MDCAKSGDLVLFVAKDYKRYTVKLEPGGRLETHRGIIHHDDAIGRPLGRELPSHLGHPFLALQPSIHDLARDIRRSSQIVFPKDAGYLLMKMDIHPGRRVVEAGTGSGAFALTVARYVMPAGRVYSYDVREDMLKLSRSNLEKVGLAEYVEFKLRDIEDGFDETEVDAVFLDVRTPWLYLDQVWTALKGGGFLGLILPTANQVIGLLRRLPQHGFGYLEVEETLIRPYKAIPGRFRPMDRMVAHTGYLVFARKMEKSAHSEVEGPSGDDVDASDFEGIE